MQEDQLEKLANDFFDADFVGYRGDEFLELDTELQQYISKKKSMVLRIIEDTAADSPFVEDFPSFLEELYKADYDIWLARILVKESLYEDRNFPIAIVDEAFAIKSLESILLNDDQYWFRFWIYGLEKSKIFGDEKFAEKLLSCLDRTSERDPLIFWIFGAFDKSIFKNLIVALKIFNAVAKRIDECTSKKITAFGGDDFYYYWNSLLHLNDYKEKFAATSFESEADRSSVVSNLEVAIKRNVKMMKEEDEMHWFDLDSLNGFIGCYEAEPRYQSSQDSNLSCSPQAWLDYLASFEAN